MRERRWFVMLEFLFTFLFLLSVLIVHDRWDDYDQFVRVMSVIAMAMCIAGGALSACMARDAEKRRG